MVFRYVYTSGGGTKQRRSAVLLKQATQPLAYGRYASELTNLSIGRIEQSVPVGLDRHPMILARPLVVGCTMVMSPMVHRHCGLRGLGKQRHKAPTL